MTGFDGQKLAGWCGGIWSPAPPAVSVTSVVHDSRAVTPGALYVALPGARVDGHDFLAAAAAAGAAGALVQQGRAHPALPCLEVADPAQGLIDLAKGHRAGLQVPVIGITGSAGKTTVKELVASMLAQRGSTCKTSGNWNNFIGLPLSVLRMTREDAFGVFEAGMNRPGEIRRLCEIFRPTVGIVTTIGEAHLEAFGNVEGIAWEKASLLHALPETGLALVDADSPWLEVLRSRLVARSRTFGFQAAADYQGFDTDGGAQTLAVLDRQRGVTLRLQCPLPGRHMRSNVLQAAAIAREMGLTEGEIVAGLRDFAPAPMRWQHMSAGGFQLVNDAYNANPLSMRSAIEAFAGIEAPGGKWLVLGGMYELGPEEAAAHRGVGEFLSGFAFEGLVCVGPRAAWIAEAARLPHVFAVRDVREAAACLHREAAPGAHLLLKASRSERLESLVPILNEMPPDGKETTPV